MLPPDFWENEKKRLLAVLRPRLAQMAYEGSRQAAHKAGIDFNPQLANTHASQYAGEQSDELLERLGGTSQKLVSEALSAWLEKPGASLSELHETLKPAFGAARASVIAATETTRAYASGEMAAYQAEGYSEWSWVAQRDEQSCPICGKLAGTRVRIGQPFGEYHGTPILQPPAHPNCRCTVRVVEEKSRSSITHGQPRLEPVLESAPQPEPAPKQEALPWKPVMSAAEAERWAADSVVKQVVTHVTDLPSSNGIHQNGFNIKKTVNGRVWGNGVYVGLNDETAEFYKKLRRDYFKETPVTLNIRINVKNVLDVDVSNYDEPMPLDFAYFENVADNIPGGRQRYIEINKQIKENNKIVRETIDAKMELFVMSRDPQEREKLADDLDNYMSNNPFIKTVEGEALARLLREHGYDALRITSSNFQEWVGGDQLVILDPQNVTVLE